MKFIKITWPVTLLILGALGLAACSKFMDSAVGYSTSLGNTIEVSAMIGSSAGFETRAVSSSEVTTATLSKFWMTAYAIGTDTTTIINDRKFAYSGGIYTDSLTYYWPTTQVKFCAVTATNGAERQKPAGIVISADTIKVASFSVENSGALSKFENQEDYIIAVNKTGKPAGTNKVGITFQHILSRISINAYAPQFTTARRPSLASFAFDSVGVSGSFAYAGNLTDQPFYYADGTGTDQTKCWITSVIDTVGSIYNPDSVKYAGSDNYWYATNQFQIPQAKPDSISGKRLVYGTYTVPWFNVIPGTERATRLFITLWYQGTAWPLSINLKDVNTSFTEYKPGYQYIYNIKVTGKADADGEKIRPQIEFLNVLVQEWGSQAVIGKIEAPDAGVGLTLKKQIDAAVAAGKKNIEVKLTSEVVTEVTLRDTIAVPTNLVIDLNGHTLIPEAMAGARDTSAFLVRGGHRFAIKGSGTIKLTPTLAAPSDTLGRLVKLVAPTGDNPDTFAIRGGTWNCDPKAYVPGYDGTSTYDENNQISCASESYRYVIVRSGTGTSEDPYSYTVTESALN